MSTRDIIEAAGIVTDGGYRLVADERTATVYRATHDYSGIPSPLVAGRIAVGWMTPQEIGDYLRFIAHFDPTHVALMEAVCEAAMRDEYDADRTDWQVGRDVRHAAAALTAYRKEHNL